MGWGPPIVSEQKSEHPFPFRRGRSPAWGRQWTLQTAHGQWSPCACCSSVPAWDALVERRDGQRLIRLTEEAATTAIVSLKTGALASRRAGGSADEPAGCLCERHRRSNSVPAPASVGHVINQTQQTTTAKTQNGECCAEHGLSEFLWNRSSPATAPAAMLPAPTLSCTPSMREGEAYGFCRGPCRPPMTTARPSDGVPDERLLSPRREGVLRGAGREPVSRTSTPFSPCSSGIWVSRIRR